MKIAVFLLLAATVAWAQSIASNPGPVPQSNAPAAGTSEDVQALNDLLNRVQTSSQKSDEDVSRLRVDKWKTDAATRQQSQASVDSIRRNLTNAVPDLIQRIQASPSSLNANFRLYRNMNALYDTFSALVETTGAFGPKDHYELLAVDIAQLDKLRRDLAERVDLLAGANDAELARLRAQVAAMVTKPAPAPKIVVDDEKPKTKNVKKKPKAASPAQTTQNQ
jgi:hypothetical protein